MEKLMKGISLASVIILVTAYFVFPAVMQNRDAPHTEYVQEETSRENDSTLRPAVTEQKVSPLAIAGLVLAAGLGAMLNVSVASDMRVLRWYRRKKLERSTAHEESCDADCCAVRVDSGLAYS